MSYHGGIIRKWRDIVQFLVSRGCTKIFQDNITYRVILKMIDNHELTAKAREAALLGHGG